MIDPQEPVASLEVGLAKLDNELSEVSIRLSDLRAAASAQLLEFQNMARELGFDLPTDLPTKDVTA